MKTLCYGVMRPFGGLRLRHQVGNSTDYLGALRSDETLRGIETESPLDSP